MTYWIYVIESFKACSYRAKKAIDSGRFPADVLKNIDDDSMATLPTTKLYRKDSPMREELKDLLTAWYVSRVDEGMGYVRIWVEGLSWIWRLMGGRFLVDTRNTSAGGDIVDEYEHCGGVHLLEESVGTALFEGVLLFFER